MLERLRSFISIRSRIKKRIIFTQISAMVILALLSLVLFQVLIGTYNQLLYQEAAQSLTMTTRAIENNFRRIEELTFNVLADSEVQDSSITIQLDARDYERFRLMRLIADRMNVILGSERHIITNAFIDIEGNETVTGRYPRRLDGLVKSEAINKAEEQRGGFIVLDPALEDDSIFCARQIRNIHDFSLTPLGTIIVRVDFRQLVQHHVASSSNQGLKLIVLSDQQIVYSDLSIDETDAMPFVDMPESGYQILNINSQKFFATSSFSTYTGLSFINIIPYNSIANITSLTKVVIFGLFSLLTVAIMFISSRVSVKITKPIESLTQKMKKVEKGDFNLDESDLVMNRVPDEVEQLQHDFHLMIQKINTLMREDRRKQTAMKDAQLKALQAQINPHFLYNTLESINWMAKTNHQENISRMVEALGHLLRSSISRKESMITLEEELNILESYLTIQKLRYEERLEIHIDVPEALQTQIIPKLSLQPIVENSINHGLENMLGTCHISIKAEKRSLMSQDSHNAALVLSVQDNGPGMPKEMLHKLLNGEVKTKGSGIGLKNISDRIKMSYGEAYGLVIDSDKQDGTIMSMVLPLNNNRL